MSWSRIAILKDKVGMSFRSLKEFNQAMVGKQVYKILKSLDLLISQILNGR